MKQELIAMALLAFLFAFLSVASPVSAYAEKSLPSYRYVRADSKKGTLTTRQRVVDGQAQTVVSLRQFCFAFGCRYFYRWQEFRAVIQPPPRSARSRVATTGGAIVSSLTGTALADGNLIEFQGDVVSDRLEGYLLPIELAAKLAVSLELGRVVEEGGEKKHPGAPAATSVIPTVAPAATPAATSGAPSSMSPANGNPKEPGLSPEVKRIVVDPGHGGNDVGTRVGSLLEKDIALFYAMRLRDRFRKEMPDVEVFLTREDDSYVSLPDRAKIANSKDASLFLSLHVNHAPNEAISGAEAYILNPNATDDDAKRTALLENDSWLKSLKEKDGTGGDVMKILADMEQTRYIQSSAVAAAYIQQELSALALPHGLKNRGVKQAMFFVLSQVAMPSVLIEMGFLSSPGDRARLMDVVFRDHFVKKLVASIRRYRDRTRASEKKD
ncbi:MAG: N-acetylmuramoyl-L-alanine amidase [Deltaproteobacteria bacterium]|nr:N-acetylmuramoyl-L-alanine amidase [Deltaproteobacteria bacterium]